MDSNTNNYYCFPSHAQYTFQETACHDTKANFTRNLTTFPLHYEFLMQWNEKINLRSAIKFTVGHCMKICRMKDVFKNLILSVTQLRSTEDYLKNNIETLPKEDFEKQMVIVKNAKEYIDKLIECIDEDKLAALRKALSRRNTKRDRIKRRKKLVKKMFIIKFKEKYEISRAIDENLKKLTDNISKIKQEEATKREGDIVLRDVLKRKGDAKKNVSLIEALLKLRKARFNTAKGRGGNVTESDAIAFAVSMDKLKTMWTETINKYNTEEKELRSMMQDSSEVAQPVNSETEAFDSISAWKRIMFGERHLLPQYNFKGDMHAFTGVRSQWDSYVKEEGTLLPVGWLLPSPRIDTFNLTVE